MADDRDIDVAHVARLARLTLTPKEADSLGADAARVLDAFADLPAGNPSRGGDDMAPPALRGDHIASRAAGEADAIVAAIPRKDGRTARVPRGL